MAKCCGETEACALPTEGNRGEREEKRGQANCPRCGQLGKSVDVVTLKGLLIPKTMKRLDPSSAYRFCKTRDCSVVYFNHAQVFEKEDVSVPVFQKEAGAATPVCYCFGFTREKIFEEVARTGQSTVQKEITQYIKKGKCACEMRNPQGECCLGNVGQVVKTAIDRKGV